jgi:hypothetical protein
MDSLEEQPMNTTELRQRVSKALNALARHIDEQGDEPVCIHVREAYDLLYPIDQPPAELEVPDET